jgi:hypothetical protein
LAVLVIAAVTAFYWNEARKEVVFLCGNFTRGVTQTSVLRQLDTGNFLRYRLQKDSAGSRIVVDSGLTFGVYRCVIEFDRNDEVISAETP